MLKDTLNKGISTPIALTVVIFLFAIIGIVNYWQYTEIQNLKFKVSELEISEKDETIEHGESDGLLKDINDGKSIMWLEPHPDDEVHSPGIFTLACGKGRNKCWVISLIGVDSPPLSENQELRKNRLEAIRWFEEQYLEEYIMLDMPRDQESGGWHKWNWPIGKVKAAYKAQIEEKQPDILLTFTPHGWLDQPEGEHAVISNIITEIQNELTYEPKPKIYWFVNTDQGQRYDRSSPPKTPLDPGYIPYNEHIIYPPTDMIDMDVYSDILGVTYWEAKLEILEHYRHSIGPLDRYLDDSAFLGMNDHKEYFFEVDEETIKGIIQKDLDSYPEPKRPQLPNKP
jgi:LmbE family N-acetylglucosaminyl deacetylase